MDPISPLLLSKALDGLWMRHIATAQNVANANSPGFRPMRVSFEQALRTAAQQGPAALWNVTPTLDYQMTPAAAGSEVRLDMELATASETAMRYAALLDLLGRQIQISRTVVRGGQ